jgi:hypothetical protein
VNPISSASQALASAASRFDAAAGALSADPLGATSIQAAVDLTTAREQFSAAVSTVRVTDDQWKNLLDIIA